MLSADYRFHGHGSLNYLFRNGVVIRKAWVLMRFVENKRRENSRVAVIVGKKTAKSAVVRNRIRRRVYEVIRTHWELVPPHTDIAVTIVSAEAAVLSVKELEMVLISVLKRITPTT